MPTEDVRRFARHDECMSGPELVARHPHCACENTEPYDGGHGRVEDEEELVFFVESPSHTDLRKDANRKRPWAPKPRQMRGVSSGRGHSVYRRAKATADELRAGATQGYVHSVGRRADGTGGIVGAFSIVASAVRAVAADDVGMACVLDTPNVADPDAPQLAHADVLWSEAAATPPSGPQPDDPLEVRRRAFEDKLARTLARDGALHRLGAFDDVDLTGLLPDVVRKNPAGYPAI